LSATLVVGGASETARRLRLHRYQTAALGTITLYYPPRRVDNDDDWVSDPVRPSVGLPALTQPGVVLFQPGTGAVTRWIW
jgi:hypothetical protein